MIEISSDRCALEDCDDDGSDRVEEDVSHDDIAGNAEVAVFLVGGKDTQVEEEEGEFGGVDGEFVEGLRGEEGLIWGLSELMGREGRMEKLR